MKHTLLAILSLFVFTACGENKEDKLHIKMLQEENAKLAHTIKDINASLIIKQKELETKESKLQEQSEALKRLQLQQEQAKKEREKNNKLSQFGISINHKKITIDTNKTKDFFENVSKSLENKIKNITTDIEKDINNTKKSGIEINEQHMNIDFNKTQNLFEAWGKKMQKFVKDVDDMAKSIDIKQ